MTKYRLAIDIGETFTDVVALNERRREILNIKVPSTPRETAKTIIKAFQEKQTTQKYQLLFTPQPSLRTPC